MDNPNKEMLELLVKDGLISINNNRTIEQLLNYKRKRLKVILLMGPRGGGKSTYANDLNNRTKGFSDIYSFADGVYGTVRNLTRRTTDYIKNNKSKAAKLSFLPSLTYRDLLVMIGDGGRLVDKDLWANRLCVLFSMTSRSVLGSNKTYTAIIDDLRYPNEYLKVEETLIELGKELNVDTEIEVKYINHTHVTEVNVEVPSEQMVAHFFRSGFTQKKFDSYISNHRRK